MPYRRAIMSAPVVLALVLMTAACAGGSAGDAAGPAASSPDATTSAAPSSPTPSSKASSSPTETEPSSSSPPEALSADDKRRYKACRDGACEVLVTEGTTFAIDPGAAGGMDTVTVTDVDGEGTGVDFDGPGIHIHLYSTAGPGASYSNGLALTVVAVQGDEAVIRLGE